MTTPLQHPAPHAAAAPGPSVGLIGLPDAAGISVTRLQELDAHLAAVEVARRTQLAALRPVVGDPVALAHRAGLERVLAELAAARSRVAEGRYGLCVRCDEQIPTARLELRPWVPMCTPCAKAHG